MTYPAGVQLSTLTFNNPTTYLGNPVTRTEITVQVSAGVVWSATGEQISDLTGTVALGPGTPGAVTFPAVDQPGYTNQAGAALTMWSYAVTRKMFFGSASRTTQKTWQPLTGQATVDFDALPGGDGGTPTSPTAFPVTSVAGQTGVVGASSLAGAVAPYLPTPDMPGKLDASKVGAPSGVAPLDPNSKVPDANLPTASNAAAVAGKVSKDTVATNVRDYGVVLDGSAATGVQLTNAISAASLLGLPLRLPQGRYLFDQVNIPSNMTIEGSGPNTVIVQNVATQPTFKAQGSLTALGALTADLAKGATTINVTQSWGLVAGDLILLTDNASYAATDASYKSGEQFRVASSTGTSITLTSPVRGSFSNTAGSYTVANGATLQKINPVKNVGLRNMAFEGHAAGTTQMLLFQYADGVTLEGVSTVSAQAGFCNFDTCRNVSATNWTLNGLVDNWASGYPGYGFIVRHASHNVRISHGISNMARHSITTMGGPYGVPRNLVFGPNIISSDTSSTSGIDTHSSGEGILIHGNVLENSGIGITCRARNMVVRGNTIRGTTSYGVTITEEARDILIDGNNLVGCTNIGIEVGQGTTTHNNVEIRSNTMRDTTGDGIKAITGMTDLRIISNTIVRTTGKGINVDAGCSDVTIAKNEVIDASLSGNGPGIQSIGTQAAGVFDIIGNTVKQKATQMSRAVYTTRTQGRATGNRAFGTYVSAGSEFNVGAGFTNADNVLYA